MGIKADEQRARIPRRTTDQRPTRPGAYIHDHPVEPGDQLVELADVHVDELLPNYLSHAGILLASSRPAG